MFYPTIGFDRYLEEIAFQRTFQAAQYNTDDVRKVLGDPAARNRFFSLEAVWRDEEDARRMAAIRSDFPTYWKLQNYTAGLRRAYLNTMPPGSEPLEKRMWWNGVWWEKAGTKGIPFQRFALDAKGELICFGFSMDYALTERSVLYGNPHYLAAPYNVLLPFKTGDILDFDPQPFGRPFQVVWGWSDAALNDTQMKCVYTSPPNGELRFSRGNQFGRAALPCQYVPLSAYRAAGSCEDELLILVSELLKRTPKKRLDDLWYDLRVELGRRRKEEQKVWLQEQIRRW